MNDKQLPSQVLNIKPNNKDEAMKLKARGCFRILPTLNIKDNVINIKESGKAIPKIEKRMSIPDQSNGGMPKAGINMANKVVKPMAKTTGLKTFCLLYLIRNFEMYSNSMTNTPLTGFRSPCDSTKSIINVLITAF